MPCIHITANWHKTSSSQLTLKKRLCNSQTFPSPAFFTLGCTLAFDLIGCMSIMLSKQNWHACVPALFNISWSLRQHCLSVHWPSDAYYTLNSSQASWLYTKSKSISLPGDKVIFIRSWGWWNQHFGGGNYHWFSQSVIWCDASTLHIHDFVLYNDL